jgi:hypothetical protein
MINRETPFLLLPIIFIYDYLNEKGYLRSVFAVTAVVIPYFSLHLLIQENDPRWFALEGIGRNIPFADNSLTSTAILSIVRLLLLIGPVLFLSIYKFKYQPVFLKIISSAVPIFIIVHFIFGTVIEARLWMPVFILLIPLATGTLSDILKNISTAPKSEY